MRVTTRMVNDAALKAGVPTNANSLLDYVKGTKSGNDLLSALKNSKSEKSKTSENEYEKLEKAADRLMQKAETFAEEGEESLFARAKESGDMEDIYKNAEALVKSYNDMLDTLQSSSNPLNSYYRKMLQEAAANSSKELSGIGFHVSKDGRITIDKDKLKAADVDSLEKALAGTDGFSGKVSFLAEKICDNAKAYAESLSSHYNASGSTYTPNSHNYDFWG